MNDKVLQQLISGQYYHIYNKGNNNEKLFFTEANYTYFLEKFTEHLYEFVKIYSYCLLPNHFHFLIKVENEKINLTGFKNLSGLKTRTISQAFSNFFNSYTKSINKQEVRLGNLFHRPFKRKLIDKDEYLISVICYIHRNPIHHGLVQSLDEYIWSSYKSILQNDNRIINIKDVLQWFNGKDNFIEFPLNDFKEIN